jgi:DNA-directed RNA polymerase subunit F
MEIKGEKFVSWAEVKKTLEKKAKDKELGYEQKNALEHLRKFSKLTEKAMNEMVGELKKIEKLRERHIVSIVNMLPQDPDELRLLFANEIVTVSDEDKKKILSIVKKFT